MNDRRDEICGCSGFRGAMSPSLSKIAELLERAEARRKAEESGKQRIPKEPVAVLPYGSD